MMPGLRTWLAAFAVALSAHGLLAVGFELPRQGDAGLPPGPPVSMEGNLAGILGSVETVAATVPETAEAVVAQPVAEPVRADPAPVSDVPKARAVTADAIAPTTAETPEPIEKLSTVKPVETTPVRPVDTHERAERERKRERQKAAERAKAQEKQAELRRKRQASQRAGTGRAGAAGAAQGGRSGRSAASPGAISRYGARVRSAILANPPGSFGRGRVVISFGIRANGGLRYARVARSSGSSALDNAALSAVRKTSPFPRPPTGASSDQLRFSIAFSFR